METDSEADRQTDRQADRQTDRHTYRQTDRQTDRDRLSLMTFPNQSFILIIYDIPFIFTGNNLSVLFI